MTAPQRQLVGSTPSHLAGERERFAGSRSVMQLVCTPDADDVDSAFEKLESGVRPRGVASADVWPGARPLFESAALVRELASGQRLVLRDRMQDLAAGLTHRRWLGTVRLSLRSLLKAAEALNEASLVPALASFDVLLERASTLREPVLDEPTRRAVLAGYARLIPELARAFAPPA